MVTTDGIKLRSARPEDLVELREAAVGALCHDGDAAEVVDLLWNGPSTRPELRLTAEVQGRAVGVALGSLSEASGVVRGHVNLLAVAPGHQGRGYGRELLRTLEERLGACGAQQLVVRGSTPAYAWPGVDFRYTAAVCLLEAEGYQRTDEAVNMKVDLATAQLDTAEDEQRLAGQGLTVRRLLPEDEPGFSAWMLGWGGTWQQEAALALTHDPVGCHIAVRGEGDRAEYAGFACHGVNRRTWFGPMGTEESLRGQGVGAVLLRRCLADQRAAGLTHAEIGWTGPLRFYARAVGASLDRAFWLYRKDC
ncbi:GNAT family N-acetyltransferase [Peterkaempfera sp. SMS 1(5)a]|uniref:GNAT family N-acetyltransferase n=1 Tax=Peterkaempfera podocarpi TaxID=3232308 RepID=UPI00366E8FC4